MFLNSHKNVFRKMGQLFICMAYLNSETNFCEIGNVQKFYMRLHICLGPKFCPSFGILIINASGLNSMRSTLVIRFPLHIRVRPRFFDQVGHETMYAST